MMNIRSILVPTDFSEGARFALEDANRLASRFGASLHVLHILKEDAFDLGDGLDAIMAKRVSFQQEVEKAAAERLVATSPRSTAHGVELIKSFEWAIDAATGIVNYAVDHDIDLIVLGKRSSRSVGRRLVGGTIEHVIRHTECPIVTVGEPPNSPYAPRVLVPVDFSGYSEEQLTVAKHFAEDLGASIDLLHVIDETSLATVYGLETTINFKDLQKRARDVCSELIEKTGGPAVPVEIHVTIGHPARDIAEFAEKSDAALIVISTHGRSGIKRFFLGSVAEQIVRLAEPTVLTLTCFGKSLLDKRTAALTESA